MATLTLTQCRALLGPEAIPSQHLLDIVIHQGRIQTIRPSGTAAPEGRVIDARQRLVAAGMINGHHHSHEHFHKGRYDNLPLELWMNYVRPIPPIPFTPRQVYLRTLIGAIEALHSGTTTLVDDMNTSPLLQPELVEAAYQAYEDIGIRALLGITLFDKPFFRALPYVEEEFSAELLQELDQTHSTSGEDLLAFAAELARTRHPRQHRVGYIVAPSAPQRCTEGFLLQTRELADHHDLPLMIHVQETRLQVVTGHLFYGSTMVDYLHRVQVLKPKTTVIHGVWLNPREMELLADTETTVQHNPTSNLKLGSGLAPLRRLLQAGVNVSLGTDGCGSIETLDMLNLISTTALVHKLRSGDYRDWIGAEETWRAATLGGAKALGMDDRLGTVEEGRVADLTLYRLDRIPFVPLNNALHQLVYAADSSTVDTVIVDGEIVMEAGKLTHIDETAIIAEIQEEHTKLAPLLRESEKSVNRILPAYERIYRRCQKEPIAAETYPVLIDDPDLSP